jgi:hypothetical protein
MQLTGLAVPNTVALASTDGSPHPEYCLALTCIQHESVSLLLMLYFSVRMSVTDPEDTVAGNARMTTLESKFSFTKCRMNCFIFFYVSTIKSVCLSVKPSRQKPR